MNNPPKTGKDWDSLKHSPQEAVNSAVNRMGIIYDLSQIARHEGSIAVVWYGLISAGVEELYVARAVLEALVDLGDIGPWVKVRDRFQMIHAYHPAFCRVV